MAEDWLDCPVLGPGWKRRESFRKSGATCGRSDTYYQSPTGERIRSKVELTRFLGPDCDLTCFDFKRGVLQHLPTKAPSSQKKKKRVWPRKAVPSIKEEQPPEPQLGSPAPQHPLAIWCENCGANILGDSAGRQRLRSLCKTCRAQRNAFNREQRTFKRVGCGDCAACQMTEDCGICTACVVQLPQPGTPRLPQSQCAQRRCLKIINKSFSCGLCSGCQTKEDCGACRICERKGKPGLKRHWKCLQRRCLKKRIMKRPRGLAAQKIPGRWPAQVVGPSGTAKDRPPSKLPRSQVRCLMRLPTVVTRNIGCKTKEPKWGQGSPAPSKLQKGLPVLTEELGPGFMLPPETDLVILQEQEGGEGIPVLRAPACILLQEYECPGLGVFIASPSVKQEVESYGDQTPGAASPLPAGFSSGLCNKGANRGQLQNPVKQEESFGNGEEEEEAAKATTPVIMEIYSLSGATPTPVGPYVGLDSVLQEFLAELNELPLPAHWEVLPPRGPDLCIIQRSPLSTMAAAVIHIQPGLYFHVVVQDVPVPPSHELYLAHPLRLTTVDEVVELICNLEAYHLCPGWPGRWEQGSRSPDCDVLVYEGRCQACCLEPYPSGSSSN
ncbi:methyl-CpG-binding domain protein 1-like isoform X8 [Trichosurus vulpecula]|uniref:methyl-CpG-binding domain protein 1-like isoform X8 n=1 Tax=Trichosurus vulpecula TaxID=9337 RepID=UPI00186B4FC5|nr:methyl-CpG-binding domain protein 1-like isoform X8 [Trichosurus vulpecula]